MGGSLGSTGRNYTSLAAARPERFQGTFRPLRHSKICRGACVKRLSIWLASHKRLRRLRRWGHRRYIVLRKELKFAADFLDAVAIVVEPTFDLFGTSLAVDPAIERTTVATLSGERVLFI